MTQTALRSAESGMNSHDTADLGTIKPIRQQFFRQFGHRSRMQALLVWLFVFVLGVGGLLPSGHAVVWEVELTGENKGSYAVAVEQLFEAFESAQGTQIRPGNTGRVALKVDTRRGLGLATPPDLVMAVMDALRKRGFISRNIMIVDQREYPLRGAGFIPSFSHGGTDFHGSDVHAWYSWRFADADWYYESPLRGELPPEREWSRLQKERNKDELSRSSFLPYLLIDGVDFWINMPVYGHVPTLGFSGALVNASLYNITNEERFLTNKLNAPVAVAEICAIPEMREKWLFTLVSMERFQFEGGPMFNALYTGGLPLLRLSADPVMLDAAALVHINQAREKAGFEVYPLPHPVLDYAEKLGVGSSTPTIVRVAGNQE
jgi:hypothetical protein